MKTRLLAAWTIAAAGCVPAGNPNQRTHKSAALIPRIAVEEIISREGKAATLPTSERFEIRTASRREGDALLFDVELIDRRGGDSAANVACVLPLDGDGWSWNGGLDAGVPVADTVKPQSIFPLAVATRPDRRKGWAVAIAPDTPCVFAAGSSRTRGLFVEARIGLSDLTRPPSRAKLRFATFPVDAAWGMRSALEEYYRLFPEAYERRDRREGLWLFHGDITGLPDPALFAFHELGELTESLRKGETAHGLLDSDAIRRERELGTGIFPYVIPGQREVGFLDRVKGDDLAEKEAGKLAEDAIQEPKAKEAYFEARYSTEEALAVLDAATEKNVPPSMRLGGLDRFRAAVRASHLVGADGQNVTVPRMTPWSGKTVTFPVNPNPFLGAGNVGAAIVEQCRESGGAPYDGIYVDSLWRWGQFLNYRREHFAAARHGLAYGPDGRPALDNALEHLTFLEELGKALRPAGRTVFGNGVRPGRFWHAQRLDVLGAEMGAADLAVFAFNRAAAGSKPYLALNHNMGRSEAADRTFLARCFLFGMYGSGDAPYFRTEAYGKFREWYATYLPLQRTMNHLGWEPVTGAKSLTEGVLAERFGRGGEVWFALHDPSGRARATDLEIDPALTGLPEEGAIATDPVSDRTLETAPAGPGRLRVRGIPIRPEGIGAVRITAR